jgi:hypothetical protein
MIRFLNHDDLRYILIFSICNPFACIKKAVCRPIYYVTFSRDSLRKFCHRFLVAMLQDAEIF